MTHALTVLRRRGVPAGRGRLPPRGNGRRPPGTAVELHHLLDDFDTTAEVDATFRTQRRVAVGYFAVFLAVTLAVPTLTLALGWWSEGRIAGMSPNFLMAAGGLYVAFFAVVLAAASLSEAVEDRMLGGGDEHLGALPADEVLGADRPRPLPPDRGD